MKKRDNSPKFSHTDKGISFVKHLHMAKRIVIADDDPGIRDIFQIIFQRAGYEVELKADGNDLLKNKFTLPDLFLVDKLLSGLDGLDICRHLKRQEKTKNIPVIMVSASPDIGRLALEAGADDYIEKPFDISYLLKVVEKYTGPNPGNPFAVKTK